jgi:hypothetical protein
MSGFNDQLHSIPRFETYYENYLSFTIRQFILAFGQFKLGIAPSFISLENDFKTLD